MTSSQAEEQDFEDQFESLNLLDEPIDIDHEDQSQGKDDSLSVLQFLYEATRDYTKDEDIGGWLLVCPNSQPLQEGFLTNVDDPYGKLAELNAEMLNPSFNLAASTNG